MLQRYSSPDLTPHNALHLRAVLGCPTPQVHLSLAEWQILTGVLGQASTTEIAAQTGRTLEQVLGVVRHLIDLGLVEVQAPAPQHEPLAPASQSSQLGRAIRRRLGLAACM